MVRPAVFAAGILGFFADMYVIQYAEAACDKHTDDRTDRGAALRIRKRTVQVARRNDKLHFIRQVAVNPIYNIRRILREQACDDLKQQIHRKENRRNKEQRRREKAFQHTVHGCNRSLHRVLHRRLRVILRRHLKILRGCAVVLLRLHRLCVRLLLGLCGLPPANARRAVFGELSSAICAIHIFFPFCSSLILSSCPAVKAARQRQKHQW